MDPSRSETRKRIVAARRALSEQAQREAATALALNARKIAPLMLAKRVAAYVPVRGEASPHVILNTIKAPDVCIPVIYDMRGGLMKFCWADQTVLNDPKKLYGPTTVRNSYGIPEPVMSQTPVRTRTLDAVLVPLVAFDRQGNRLGLGAGFYDRAFAFKNWHTHASRPALIGIAYTFQEVDQLEAASWDVPLDVIITPAEIIHL